jgi:hypothetical protein
LYGLRLVDFRSKYVFGLILVVLDGFWFVVLLCSCCWFYFEILDCDAVGKKLSHCAAVDPLKCYFEIFDCDAVGDCAAVDPCNFAPRYLTATQWV